MLPRERGSFMQGEVITINLETVKRTVKEQIRRMASLNYYTAKALFVYGLARHARRFKKPPLLIYQMGKVGSQAVYAALKNSKLDRPVYHTHGLSDEYVGLREKHLRKYFGTSKERYVSKIPWEGQYLRECLSKDFNGEKIKIVALVREPVSRKIASFFQQLSKVEYRDEGRTFKIVSYKNEDEFELTATISDMEPLTNLFLDLHKKNLSFDQARTFFDREFKGVLGIDIFASEFPKSKGWKIYNEKLADVLLIRMENLNECVAEAFKEFLDIDGIVLPRTNIGREKDYAPIYEAFKKTAILPDAFLDEMYSTKYARHFYTEEEIHLFKKKWKKS